MASAAPARPLSGYAADLVSRIDAARARARALTEGLSEAEFNRSIEEGSWSMAQCFDHLSRIGEALMPPLRRAAERTERHGWTSDAAPRYGVFARYFIRATGPLDRPRVRRVRTQRLYRPSPSKHIGELLARFDQLQDELETLVRRTDGLDLTKATVPSPAMPLIRLPLGAWIESLVGHQERHFAQAARVLEALRRTPP